MTTTRNGYLDKMFGIEGAAELLKQSPQKLAEALTAKGVAHKSTDADTTDTPPQAEATEQAGDTFAELLLQLIESQAGTLKEMDDLKALVTSDQETRLKEKAAFDERYQKLEAENKALRDEMKLSPRNTLSGTEKQHAEAEIEKRAAPTAADDLIERLRRQVAGES